MNPSQPDPQRTVDEPAASADSRGGWQERLLLAATVLLTTGRMWLAFHRAFDSDELEHLHAGFCVWRGMLPYRDFFDQHGPVLWCLSLPLFQVFGPSLSVLFACRVIVWLLETATLMLTWLAGKQLFGRRGAAIACFLLATFVPFQEKAIEWRPDNVATPLVMLAVWCFIASDGRWESLRAGAAGAALAAAFACTQKVAFVGTGIVAAFLALLLFEPRDGRWRRLVAFAAAASGIAITIALVHAWLGNWSDFFHMTVLLPARWRTREPMLPVLMPMLGVGPFFWAAATGGLVMSIQGAACRRPQAGMWLVVVAGTVAHGLGVLVVPAAFMQYYLPMWPLAAILGARAVLALGHGHERENSVSPTTRHAQVLSAMAATTLVVAIVLLPTPFAPVWRTVAILSVAVVTIARAAGAQKLAPTAVLVAVAVGSAPFLASHFQASWSHRPQSARIERLMEATTENDRFFDGFTGHGALRPHAFFWFWINQHSWPLVSDREQVDGVIAALADPETRLVLDDVYLRELLPEPVRRYLREHFTKDDRFSWPDCDVLVRNTNPLP